MKYSYNREDRPEQQKLSGTVREKGSRRPPRTLLVRKKKVRAPALENGEGRREPSRMRSCLFENGGHEQFVASSRERECSCAV